MIAEESVRLHACRFRSCGSRPANMYEKMGQQLYFRTLERTIELIGPWTMKEPGFKHVEEWIEVETDIAAKIKKSWGTGALKGAFLQK